MVVHKSTAREQNWTLTQKVRLRIATERNTNVPFWHSDEVLLGSVPGILPVYNICVSFSRCTVIDLFVSKFGSAREQLK